MRAARARAPAVAALGLALAAGLLDAAGTAWAVGAALAFVLLARTRRGRALELEGLGALALAAWFAAAALHHHARAATAPRDEGTWRAEVETREGVVGRLADGGPRFELPRGAAADGERVRLVPTKRRASARPPASVRRHEAEALPRRVEADEVLRLAPRPFDALASVRRALERVRAAGLVRVDRLRGETTRGLAAALLFGDRSRLPTGLADLFTRTGTRHALAVSGLHVGLVAGLWIWPLGSALAFLGGKLSRRLARREAWRALLLALLVPVAGGGAPVLRAALALSLAQLAAVLGSPRALATRRVDALSLWAVAFLLEWCHDPGCTRSISVLLSYGATLGLLAFTRPLLAWTRAHLPNAGRVAAVGRYGHARPLVARLVAQRGLDLALGGAVASLAANLATLPIVWGVFGEWSWVGGLATLFVLPWLALYLGLAWLWVLVPLPPLERALDALGAAQLALLELFDRLPGTPVELPTRPSAYLALLALATFLALRGPRWRRLACVAWGAALLPWRGPTRALEVYALDVGHGTAVLVRAPDGPAVLFDAGSRDRRGVGRDAVAPLLRELDVGRLVVVCSHSEADHAGALPWLVERWPPLLWGGALPARLGERLPHAAPRVDLAAGRVPLDPGAAGWSATLVRGLAELGNEGSRDLELRWRGRRLLLCGDAEERGRARTLELGLLTGPCDLLLLPHHGSDTPWLGPLLAATRPARVWTSAGARPALADELERRGLAWRSTHAEGALELRLAPRPDAGLARPERAGAAPSARKLRSSGPPSDGPDPEPDLRGHRHERAPSPAADRRAPVPSDPRHRRPGRRGAGSRAAARAGARAARGPPERRRRRARAAPQAPAAHAPRSGAARRDALARRPLGAQPRRRVARAARGSRRRVARRGRGARGAARARARPRPGRARRARGARRVDADTGTRGGSARGAGPRARRRPGPARRHRVAARRAPRASRRRRPARRARCVRASALHGRAQRRPVAARALRAGVGRTARAGGRTRAPARAARARAGVVPRAAARHGRARAAAPAAG
ncbi:MAG: ComEC/Rec2 family competence protein [Planctomycetes bacterium]|nr:ComEC/Rec2 family competence protein [Planctomycetota bacterium]